MGTGLPDEKIMFENLRECRKLTGTCGFPEIIFSLGRSVPVNSRQSQSLFTSDTKIEKIIVYVPTHRFIRSVYFHIDSQSVQSVTIQIRSSSIKSSFSTQHHRDIGEYHIRLYHLVIGWHTLECNILFWVKPHSSVTFGLATLDCNTSHVKSYKSVAV